MAENKFSADDYSYMSLALKLAQRGRYTTTTNPCVGCVIVANNKIIGEGWHQYSGHAHAEVNALKSISANEQSLLKTSTAYVTLEPCSFDGRTGACAKALIKSGVQRVVIATSDPHPEVSGKGVEMLQEAGINVDVGILENEARKLIQGFIKRMVKKMPYVTLKVAATLDGATAMHDGESKWITGKDARQDVQFYRAKSGAILSSAKTVIEDDARLNIRLDRAALECDKNLKPFLDANIHPIRIILDKNLSLSKHLSIFKTQGQIIIFTAPKQLHCLNEEDYDARVQLLSGLGAQVIEIDLNSDYQLDLTKVLHKAADFQINYLWVEAGKTLSGSFIQQDLVDELVLYYATKISGEHTQRMFERLGVERLSDSLQYNVSDCRQVGDDIRLTLNKE